MLRRILVAVVEGIAAWLVCVALGMLLASIGGPGWAAVIGTFLKAYASLIGLLVAIYVFAVGNNGSWVWPGRNP